MKKSSLRAKLLLSVGVIILIVLGISTFLHIQDLQRNSFEAFEWRSKGLANVILFDLLNKYTLGLPIDKAVLGAMSLHCIKIYELNRKESISHIAVIDEC
jgi:multisubunit Na+/H+ antiporter MnhB subunit